MRGRVFPLLKCLLSSCGSQPNAPVGMTCSSASSVWKRLTPGLQQYSHWDVTTASSVLLGPGIALCAIPLLQSKHTHPWPVNRLSVYTPGSKRCPKLLLLLTTQTGHLHKSSTCSPPVPITPWHNLHRFIPQRGWAGDHGRLPSVGRY
jgi:hypothetical protein